VLEEVIWELGYFSFLALVVFTVNSLEKDTIQENLTLKVCHYVGSQMVVEILVIPFLLRNKMEWIFGKNKNLNLGTTTLF